MIVYRSRNRQKSCGAEGLQCGVVVLLHDIPAVNGLYGVIAVVVTVEPFIGVHICEVKVGIYTHILLFRKVHKLGEAAVSAHFLFKFHIIGHGGCHATVCKTGQTDIDIPDTRFIAQLTEHLLQILKGRQRLILGHGHRQNRRADRNRSEAFQIQRNVGALLLKLGQDARFNQVIPVAVGHAGVACIVFAAFQHHIFRNIPRYGLEHEILGGVASGILSVRNNRPLGIRSGGRSRL